MRGVVQQANMWRVQGPLALGALLLLAVVTSSVGASTPSRPRPARDSGASEQPTQTRKGRNVPPPSLKDGNDPYVLQFPCLPGLLTAQGAQGGLLGHGYDPLLSETRSIIVPPSYTHYDGSMNLFQDPLSQQIFKVPDQIVVAADSETTEVQVSSSHLCKRPSLLMLSCLCCRRRLSSARTTTG
jgi:hypothetical protein